MNRYILIILFTAYGICNETQAQKLKIAIVSVGEVNPDHLTIAEEAVLDFYQAKVKFPFVLTIDDKLLSKPRNEEQEQTLQVLNVQASNERLANFKTNKFDFIIGITDSALTIGEKLISDKMLIRGLAAETIGTATISTYKLK